NSDQSHNSYKQYKIDSWANTDLWTHQRWDQVPRRSKHPLLTGHTRREPYVMYQETVDTERYTEAVGGQSWSTKYRHAVAWDIKLDNIIIYINELMTEQSVSLQNGFPLLFIPTLVVLHMLEFLCYRHIDTMRAQTALNDLQNLLRHDQGVYVDVYSRDISWQILGICQQISGNLQAALYSYQQSLGQNPLHKIQSATLMRIHELG
ncbi:uncharacterized protein LOC130053461, partial [Ostrea edulis]|uniref:uncharacterized protein LOC130053461 n=1 Tax=Ostrea edulis TaxID=37623 RepID=UPI0024AF500D